MAILDLKARVRAIPYVTPPPPPSRAAEAAAAADAALAASAIAKAESNLKEKSGKWIGFNLGDVIPEAPIKVLDKTIGALQKVTNILAPILKFLALFVGAFASFASILSALINLVQIAVNNWAKDMMGAGAYMNVIVPPGLMKNFQGSIASGFMATGGFEGFMGRLGVSLNNDADPNRPVFSNNAKVGGFMIVVDSESPASFFASLKQLGNLFDFVNLLPINTEPPPPTSPEGLFGNYFSKDYPEGKLGIELKWNAPPLKVSPMFYRISRSVIPGGTEETTYPVPSKLGGSDGFIHAVRVRLATFFSQPNPEASPDKMAPKKGEWPPVLTYQYNDPKFNGGIPVVIKANPVTGGGSFIDYDISMENGKPEHHQYYYVVESGFGTPTGGLWGPRTAEIKVPMTMGCISPDVAAAIQHGNGRMEYATVGMGALGSWSSISLRFVIPFMPLLIEMLNKLLNMVKGMLATSSSAFKDFIDALIEKIEYYMEIITILNAIVTQVKNITLDQSVAFLFVPAEEGGVTGFMSRVRAAQQPGEGFTGPNGMTMGIVFMFGIPLKGPTGDTEESALKSQTDALQTSFNLILSLLTGD